MAEVAERPFLRATWRALAMVNYVVPDALLAPRVPRGTELETFRGDALVSVVGFRFLNTRVLGVAVPQHRDFDEVNLRFYVRRRAPEGWRRGVTFIREVVPRRMIAAVARTWFGEPYIALPMRHAVDAGAMVAGGAFTIRYELRHHGHWLTVEGRGSGPPSQFAPGSIEEFITEHYWGYTARRDGWTAEYRVAHEPWRVWRLRDATFRGDATRLYGGELAACLAGAPHSALLADGSDVAVYHPTTIEPTEPTWPAA